MGCVVFDAEAVDIVREQMCDEKRSFVGTWKRRVTENARANDEIKMSVTNNSKQVLLKNR